jgi:hypothetical protein
MPTYPAQQIDANRRTITSNESYLFIAPWTFVTATTGATGAHTVFTMTGDWLVSAMAACSVDLTGAGTLELGVAGNTAGLLAQIADATTLDAGEVWVDDTPTAGVKAIPTTKILTGGADIILTIGSTAITAGTIAIYLTARPLSNNADIVLTTPA